MTFLQPHYVPDNYKRNGGRSAWKSDLPKGAAGCEDDDSPRERADDFPPEAEGGRGEEDDADKNPDEPELSAKPRGAERERDGEGDEDEDEKEEEEEGQESEECKELEDPSAERMGEMLELPSSLASSPLHHPVLGRRDAQRDRLNKILLDLLYRSPNKNGEGPGSKQGGRSSNHSGFSTFRLLASVVHVG